MRRFVLYAAIFANLALSVLAGVCPVGKYCTAGTDTVLGSCSSVQYSPLGVDTCLYPPAGYTPNADQSYFELCPSGTPYSKPASGIACSICPIGICRC